jgi:hypothetical protein
MSKATTQPTAQEPSLRGLQPVDGLQALVVPLAKSKPALLILPAHRSWRLRLLVFAGLAASYLAAGLWLSFRAGLVVGDALSRVADARFVLFSRDPHLAAMGFVFTPLTTLLQLPLVAAMNASPQLLSHAVPAIVMSSLCMSAAAWQLYGLVRDRGSSAVWAGGLTTAFALHPMIMFYAANGMSEAPFLLTMTVCARFLVRWTASDDVHDLAMVGISLALAYLVRYDGLAAAVTAGGLVLVVTWVRRRGTVAAPLFAGLMDATIVVGPVSAAFSLWAGISWLLTGQAFAQFSSVYGNSEILRLSGGSADTPAGRLLFSVMEALWLQPLLLVVAVAALVLSALRRSLDALAIGSVFGPVLAFQTATYASGGTFAFLRFSIVAIPLAVALTATLLPRMGLLTARRPGPAARLHGRPHGPSQRQQGAILVAAVVVLVPALVTSWVVMSSERTAPQEYLVPSTLTPSLVSARTRSLAEQQARMFSSDRALAEYLDSMQLPEGSVATDTASSFAVVTASAHPRQFLIPSDEDFLNALNDPVRHSVLYLLAVENTGRGTADVLNRRYSTLYSDGAGVASLAMVSRSSGLGQSDYRLYRVHG